MPRQKATTAFLAVKRQQGKAIAEAFAAKAREQKRQRPYKSQRSK